jgi:hypothetical protein
MDGRIGGANGQRVDKSKQKNKVTTEYIRRTIDEFHHNSPGLKVDA